MNNSKPNFQAVVDLGLRDVGVRTDQRRLAVLYGKVGVASTALVALSLFVACLVVQATGAADATVWGLAAATTVAILGLAVQAARRAPTVVWKVAGRRGNQLAWLPVAWFASTVPAIVVLGDWRLAPLAAVAALFAAMWWRVTVRAPAAVDRVREALAEGEPVLGDGFGVAAGRRGADALRVVACTDRRLLVVSRAGPALVDAPYGDVAGFGIRWTHLGRAGTLSLTLGAETVEVTSITPLNLLSIARALQSHGVRPDDPALVAAAQAAWEEAQRAPRRRPLGRGGLVARLTIAATALLMVVAALAGMDITKARLALAETTATKLPVDGRSNLTGGAASLAYTPGAGLRELVRDEDYGAGPNDGARWELRTPFMEGDNVVSLSHYVFVAPVLDDRADVAAFVAGKNAEHRRLAGAWVTHTERVVAGRTGYVWTHRDRRGYWYRVAWFPHPVHTVRLECIAREQRRRFERLCAEAFASLRFRDG